MEKIDFKSFKRKIYRILPGPVRRKMICHLLPPVQSQIENIVFRVAVSPQDYLSAFNLVYKAFVRAGFTRPSNTPFRLAPQHCNENARVFIGVHKEKEEENLIYSISIFPDSEMGLPMDMVFQKELDLLRSQGRFLVEAGHLASDCSYSENNMSIPMLGNKILHQYASQHLHADDIVIAIHPKFKWIYEDLLLFKQIGAIKSYSYANGNPAIAMRLDLRTIENKYKKVYNKVSKSNNLYDFFFNTKSDSILLSHKDSSVEKKLLEHIEYLYGFRK